MTWFWVELFGWLFGFDWIYEEFQGDLIFRDDVETLHEVYDRHSKQFTSNIKENIAAVLDIQDLLVDKMMIFFIRFGYFV